MERAGKRGIGNFYIKSPEGQNFSYKKTFHVDQANHDIIVFYDYNYAN